MKLNHYFNHGKTCLETAFFKHNRDKENYYFNRGKTCLETDLCKQDSDK